jgi:hypothetical protein
MIPDVLDSGWYLHQRRTVATTGRMPFSHVTKPPLITKGFPSHRSA